MNKIVKITDKSVRRCGEAGRVVGKRMTPLGIMYEIEFNDGLATGLYSIERFRVLE